MQKVKSTFFDANGNRKHLLKRHRVPQAPQAPVAALTHELPAEPITGNVLMEQKEVLAPVSAPEYNLNQTFNHNVDYSFSSGQYNNGTTISSSTFTTTSFARQEPVILERVERDVVVQERIHPVEKEEIQPIIYREREQLDVKQITQMLHETEIRPTVLEQRELPAERREAVIERGAPIQENIILATREVDAVARSSVVHAPIVEETIKKTVIEEVQPVLERDIFVPTVLQQTQPIYEKIVEAPVLYRETRTVRELGTEYINAPFVDGELNWERKRYGKLETPAAFTRVSQFEKNETFYSPSLQGKSTITDLKRNFEATRAL